MVQKTGVNVHIGSEFDAKGFKQAQSALTKLGGSAKKLAGAVGLAYGAKALVSYGKASMKAAADDQKAQKILASNLKNVGLAYASVDAESFIKSMEKQTAILDDQLRPAYGQLAQVTGSATKAQDLMQLAFDVSSGSGLDYASTVDILSQAYVGNTKGLKQLNLGLTQAELKAMSFEQITTKLRQNFAGAGGVALDSYAGSMAKLSVATANASETIGTALLDAIIKISGSNGVDGLISKIDTLASAFASVVTQVGNAVSALTGTATQKAFSPGYIVSGGRAGSKTVAPTGAGNMALSVLSQDTQRSDAVAKKKAEDDAIKRNKQLAALAKSQANSAALQLKAKKTQALIDKANLALGKGSDVFDMDKIQLNAALINQTEQLGKATTSSQALAIANDIQRLKVKKDIIDLEDAIASKDDAAIARGTAKLNEDLKILGTLQNQNVTLLQINTILESIKPKDLINLTNLDDAFAKLIDMQKVIINPFSAASTAIAGTTYNPTQALDRNYDLTHPLAVVVTNFPTTGNGTVSGAGTIYNPTQNPDRNYDNYVININAGVISDPNAFVDLIQNALNEIARRGNSTTYAGAIAA